MAPGPKKSSAARRENAAQNNDINHIQRRSIQTLFAETELNLLRTIDGFKSFNQGDEDVFVVLCGCTDKKYGDTVGKLIVSSTGQFTITCDCPLEHIKNDKEKKHAESTDQIRMTPKEFESHARSGVRRWKNNIWVIKGYKKVSLKKSGLLKYYKYVANESNWDYHRSIFVHRDEFLSCSECQKERRFRLRTIDECRAFHDASRSINWKCADHCYITNCDEEEERVSRKSYRGCPHVPVCMGCTSCVCLGCNMCRFKECDCRTCDDYIQNVEP